MNCAWKLAGSECACYTDTDRSWRKVVWSRPSKDAAANKARGHGGHRDAKDQGQKGNDEHN